MVLNQNIANCILVSLIIVIAVHYLFSNKGIKRTPKRVIRVDKSYEPFSKDVYNAPPVSNNSVQSDVSSENPLPFNEEASLEYITTLLTGPQVSQGETLKPAKSRKQFNNDFFGFRDTTSNNTSIRYDSVDKIQRLYLEGNTSDARGYKATKIKDLYDDLTKGSDLYLRQCVRLPEYDNFGDDGFTTSPGLHPTSASPDGWNYPNEKTINGGAIVPGLYGSDPYANFSMPV